MKRQQDAAVARKEQAELKEILEKTAIMSATGVKVTPLPAGTHPCALLPFHSRHILASALSAAARAGSPETRPTRPACQGTHDKLYREKFVSAEAATRMQSSPYFSAVA